MPNYVVNGPVRHCCGRPAGECACHGLTQREIDWLLGQAAAVGNAAPAPPAPLPVLDVEAARQHYDPAARAREAGEQRPVVCGPQLPTPRPARPPVTNAPLEVLDLEAERRGYDPATLNREGNEQRAVYAGPELGLPAPRRRG